MKLRIIIWLYLLLGIYSLLLSHTPDSLWQLTIRELTIEHSREIYFREDKKVIRPDSSQLAFYRNSTVGEILSGIAPVYVNSYGGTGSASGILLRGGNTAQSVVMWNGFPINSLTLGSADLSLLPACGFNDISMTYSAAGSLYSTGAFGGSIDLNNKAQWKTGLDISIAPEAGSYGDKRFSFSGKGGNNFIQIHTIISRQQAANNFVFSDTYKYGSPSETIQNNAVNNTVIIQNVFLKLPANNKLEAGFWYQAKMKEIPAIMGSYLPGSAYQRDSSFKAYVKWNKLFRHSALQIKSAYFYDHMQYRDNFSPTDNLYLIDSKMQGKRIMADGFYRVFLGNFLSFDAGMGISAYSASVSNYGGEENELIPAVFTGVKFRHDRLITNVSVRKEFHSANYVKPLISAGIRTEIIPQKLAFRINYSDQFRVPTFNDKYWKPGGNPDLLPEKGWSSDAGFEINMLAAKSNNLFLDITAYITNINNLIQWMPGETGIYWSPKNTKNVLSNGLETRLRYNYSSGDLKSEWSTAYSFNNSKITASHDGENTLPGKNLIYRPKHQLRIYSHLEIKRFSFSANMNLSGKRFTTEDNNPVYAMPAHAVFNIYSGYRIKLRNMSGAFQLKVNNLLDRQYQYVRSYPMPGRTYHIGLVFNYYNLNN